MVKSPPLVPLDPLSQTGRRQFLTFGEALCDQGPTAWGKANGIIFYCYLCYEGFLLTLLFWALVTEVVLVS